MKKHVRYLLILFFMVAPMFLESTIAQPPPNMDIQDIPIDGGLSVLIVAGLAYGAKKLRDSKKEDSSS